MPVLRGVGCRRRGGGGERADGPDALLEGEGEGEGEGRVCGAGRSEPQPRDRDSIHHGGLVVPIAGGLWKAGVCGKGGEVGFVCLSVVGLRGKESFSGA